MLSLRTLVIIAAFAIALIVGGSGALADQGERDARGIQTYAYVSSVSVGVVSTGEGNVAPVPYRTYTYGYDEDRVISETCYVYKGETYWAGAEKLEYEDIGTHNTAHEFALISAELAVDYLDVVHYIPEWLMTDYLWRYLQSLADFSLVAARSALHCIFTPPTLDED